MRVVPAADELHKQIDHHQHRLSFLVHRCVERQLERLAASHRNLHGAVRHTVGAARSKLERLAGRLAHLKPHVLVTDRHRRVAIMADRLERAVRRRVDQHDAVEALRSRLDAAVRQRLTRLGERVNAMERELIAIDPRQVLRRGYSYTTRDDGNLVRSIRDVNVGDGLVTHVADGTIGSVVGASKRRPKRKRDASADQLDLFDPSG